MQSIAVQCHLSVIFITKKSKEIKKSSKEILDFIYYSLATGPDPWADNILNPFRLHNILTMISYI